MYAAYFGLREPPFALTPDPAYVYLSRHHREGLAHLLYGTNENGGFVQLTGEVGTGKTTLARTLLEQGLVHVDIALCLNPRLTAAELLATICDELGVSYPSDQPGLKPLVDALNTHLLNAHAAGRHTVLVIDEAQNLSRELLEQIRLLTNLETTKHKLLRIILVGQPELRRLLARPDLRQLTQRITAHYHLPPLDQKETAAYIDHRLRVADGRGDLFTPSALRAVYRHSGGIPRLINILCDRALLGAYGQEKRQVDAGIVHQAAREALQVIPNYSQREKRAPRSRLAPVIVLAGLAMIGIGLWLPRTDLTLTATPVQAPATTAISARPPAPIPAPSAAPPAALRQSTEALKPETTSPPLPSVVNTLPPASRPSGVAASNAQSSPTLPALSLSQPLFMPPLTALEASSLPLALNSNPPPPPTAPRFSPTPLITPESNLTPSTLAQTSPVSAPPSADSSPTPPPAASDSSPTPPTVPAPPRAESARLVELLRKTNTDSANERLLAAWGVSPPQKSKTAFCERIKIHNLRCLSGQGNWDALRRFNRPAVLQLAGPDGIAAPALLRTLIQDTATLDIAGQTTTVPLVELTPFWSGQYLLLWRPQTEEPIIGPGNTGQSVRWLRQRLALATGQPPPEAPPEAFDATLGKQVRAYQQEQGLQPDGVAGGRTLVLLGNLVPTPGIPVLDRPPQEP